MNSFISSFLIITCRFCSAPQIAERSKSAFPPHSQRAPEKSPSRLINQHAATPLSSPTFRIASHINTCAVSKSEYVLLGTNVVYPKYSSVVISCAIAQHRRGSLRIEFTDADNNTTTINIELRLARVPNKRAQANLSQSIHVQVTHFINSLSEREFLSLSLHHRLRKTKMEKPDTKLKIEK